MPLTTLQQQILAVIAGNRSVESHVAGGLVLNASSDSARISRDLDIFHDVKGALDKASIQDCEALVTAGFEVKRRSWEETFRSAEVSREQEQTHIDWAQDAAWRFFPIEQDPVLQWRLHPFDALTNKALAMGSRNETRDLIDLVSYSDRYPLHAVVWAACAKDPGYSPLHLLEMMRRFARIDLEAMREMRVTIPPTELKMQWIELAEETEIAILAAAQAGLELGLAFVRPDSTISWYDDPTATPHQASLGGVIPKFNNFTPMPPLA